MRDVRKTRLIFVKRAQTTQPPDIMAAHTMSRHQQFPPIYQTPQSGSPASVQQSPQHEQHARSLYAQPSAQMPQGMYYPQQYNIPQHSPYGPHPGAQQHPSMASGTLLMSQPGQPQMHNPGAHPHQPGMTTSPRSKMNPTPLQRPPSGIGHSQTTPTVPPGSANSMHGGTPSGPGVNPNAAPGPIPATTPLVVRQDNNGVQWIAFEYSRDRVKMEYTIRCDVESVNVDELTQEFKTENCVYPRACCPKDQYKGNRLHYETECNTVGWALAQLNPCLRGKRGLIQRAVDSWRNSNQDPRLRSRRVRRMAKISNRKQVAQTQHQGQMAGPAGPGPATGVPTTNGAMAAGAGPPRQGSLSMGGGSQMHHHHANRDGSAPGGNDDVSANNDYGDASNTHHHQPPNGISTSSSPADARHTGGFYPAYPSAHSIATGSGLPSAHDGMDQLGGGPHGTAHPVAASQATKESEEERNSALFGDLPESKRRKFILVEDTQRGTRVRVRVMLDQVKMDDLPDSYRKGNSVYPRSYFPTEMQSPPTSARGSRFFDDPEDDEEADSSRETTVGRTLVEVPMLDGSEVKVPMPRMNRARRNKEVTLNDLGYRMSWSQSRVFAGRTLFLQRCLDAYRNKMRSAIMTAGQDAMSVAPHFETRVGKRRWLERNKRTKREASP
ncbi:MAG: hypothetical protein M1822_006959 [Bathelium mastoideum]|nr:MAG: hypothetical protein M1822_006959 [Bathelium mastoideum]